MALFEKWRGIATEAQGFEKDEDIFLVRDARGNWINENTGEIFAQANEPEEDDEDADS